MQAGDLLFGDEGRGIVGAGNMRVTSEVEGQARVLVADFTDERERFGNVGSRVLDRKTEALGERLDPGQWPCRLAAGEKACADGAEALFLATMLARLTRHEAVGAAHELEPAGIGGNRFETRFV